MASEVGTVTLDEAARAMTLDECLDAARGHIKPAIGRAKSARPQDAALIELLVAAIEEIDGAIAARLAVSGSVDELDVERLARAICNLEAAKNLTPSLTFDHFDEEGRDVFRAEARQLAAAYTRDTEEKK